VAKASEDKGGHDGLVTGLAAEERVGQKTKARDWEQSLSGRGVGESEDEEVMTDTLVTGLAAV
jgi:hypothetical protein